MIKGNEDTILFFTGSGENGKRTPIQNLIFDIVNMVDYKIRVGYINDIKGISDVPAPDMLIIVTANIFANISHHIMNPIDMKMRLELFEELQHGFNNISQELFLALQTYFSDEKSKN